MNSLLCKNRPKDSSAEEFEKAWNNSSYTLEALYKTIKQLQEECKTVRRTDFDCPNHYAKLAFEAGMLAAYDKIVDMLPKSAKD
jgi:hypothetical protein